METRWCVGCRVSMQTAAMIYALEHDLVGYADGSNREQIPSEANLTGTAENYPSIVNRTKDFAMEYAVHFLTPTYEYGSRENRRTKLKALGFDIDYLSHGPQQEDLGDDEQRGHASGPSRCASRAGSSTGSATSSASPSSRTRP